MSDRLRRAAFIHAPAGVVVYAAGGLAAMGAVIAALAIAWAFTEAAECEAR